MTSHSKGGTERDLVLREPDTGGGRGHKAFRVQIGGEREDWQVWGCQGFMEVKLQCAVEGQAEVR